MPPAKPGLADRDLLDDVASLGGLSLHGVLQRTNPSADCEVGAGRRLRVHVNPSSAGDLLLGMAARLRIDRTLRLDSPPFGIAPVDLISSIACDSRL